MPNEIENLNNRLTKMNEQLTKIAVLMEKFAHLPEGESKDKALEKIKEHQDEVITLSQKIIDRLNDLGIK